MSRKIGPYIPYLMTSPIRYLDLLRTAESFRKRKRDIPLLRAEQLALEALKGSWGMLPQRFLESSSCGTCGASESGILVFAWYAGVLLGPLTPRVQIPHH